MDDLDFSSPPPAKPAPKPAAPTAQAPVYIPAIARAFFEAAGKEESAAANTVFFAENQKAGFLKRDKMYYLVEGEVVLAVKGKPIAAIKAGQIFGEMSAITDAPRTATALARTPCRVIALDDRQFMKGLQRKPEFALMMTGVMIQRLRGMMAKLSGVPSAGGAKESPRVFDKSLLASMAQGLGEQAQMRCEKGKVIMVAGQTGALMYVVLEGRVAISIRGAVVQYVGPGGVFGEMALIDQSPRAANASAETDCVLLGINKPVFLNLVKTDPTFGASLLAAVAERVRTTAAGIN
ncbi:MAG: Crp/Fnr family transcriptional regulator [Betaproteobacteria bacterium]